MIDPSLPLQAAIVAALKGSDELTALIGGRVYDDVPAAPVFPYISLGPDDVNDDPDQCVGGAEVFPQVNIWSRAKGRVEAKRIVALCAVILDAPLVVEGHAVTIHQITRNQVLWDPDGMTKHGILVPRYVTTPV